MVSLLEAARRDLSVPGAAGGAKPRESERPRRQAQEHLRDEVVGQRDATRRGLGRRLSFPGSLSLRRHGRHGSRTLLYVKEL